MSKDRLDEKFIRLDALSYNRDGGLALGASNMNTRSWTGSLCYFVRPEDAPLAPVSSASLGAGIADLTWVPETDRLLACNDNGALYLWQLSDKNTFRCLSQKIVHDDIVSRISINCDASKFISASYDHSITVWDCEDFVPNACFTGHQDIVWDAAFHSTQPDIFITCSQDGQIILWDQRKLKPASIIDCKHLPSLPTCVAWQPNSEHRFAIGTETGELLVQDNRTADSQATVLVHSRLVHRIAFSPLQCDWLASVSQDCTVAISKLDASAGTVIYRDWSHKDYVQGLSWNPVNNICTTCSWDNHIQNHRVPIQAGNGSDVMDTETNFK